MDYQEPDDLYSMDPFKVDIGDLGTKSAQKINILKDCFSFFQNVLSDDSFVDQWLDDIPKGFFSNAHGLLRRFAADLFLGTKNYLNRVNVDHLNALGKFAVEIISNEIDSDILVQRREKLVTNKNIF